jgi:hypothetical protein
VEGLKARRGDLSGPVLAILVTLILLAIGAAIIAYFTLFAGQARTPVLVVKDQPIAYNIGGSPPSARVEVVVANIGTAQVTLKAGAGQTRLEILAPFTATASLATDTTIVPGASKILTFTFGGQWSSFALHSSANARLVLRDTAGNTVGMLEVNIRILGSS